MTREEFVQRAMLSIVNPQAYSIRGIAYNATADDLRYVDEDARRVALAVRRQAEVLADVAFDDAAPGVPGAEHPRHGT